MKRIALFSVALFTALILCSNAAAFQPHSGLWYNANEPGSGYIIDIQNGILQLGVYVYESGGSSEWYLAAGVLTNAGRTLSATLDKYRNGQCISCPYTGPPIPVGNDGPITITFTSEMSATLTLPGGRTSTIAPWDFGFGALPAGLLGEWVFVYDIGSTTFADRFNFSTTASATSGGNGTAIDAGRRAICELQISGSLAGYVACFQFSSSDTTLNSYAFRYGLDETYGGNWISPFTASLYTMKGFRIKGSNGVAKSAPLDDNLVVSASKATLEGAAAISAPDAALQAALAEIAEALRAALR